MIRSRLKAFNSQRQALLFHQCKKHTRSQHRNKPKIKRRIQQPHRTTPRPREPTPFVTDLKQIHDPEEALSLFHEYHQIGYKHDYPSYASLIYKLARARHFEAVDIVLGYIQTYNIRCKETLFIALIRHYGKAHLVDKAVQLFHRITSFDCVRTLQSLNTLLYVLIDNDRLYDAKDMFDSLYKMGLRPNSISFNIMINGWLQKGDWQEACRVFDEMLERKVQPSVVTYNSLIGFLCRKGDVEKAKGVFEGMFKKRKYPNAVTYALLMEGLCSIGEFDGAKKMMFDMAYRGCKPKLINFGVLLTDLGKRGKIDEAKSLLAEMKKRRFKPDVVIYNILINYLCKEGRAAEAYKVFVEMQVGGCEPNAATYRMMADGFCAVGDFEGALKVLNSMLISQHCPRLETFCFLIEGLLKSGKIEDACFILEEMEKRKLRLDLNVWEGLVRDACVGDGGAGRLVGELTYAH